MVSDSQKSNSIKKISEFQNLMIEAAASNNPTFEYEGKNYDVHSDGVFVQTLIDNRILLRIYIDKDKNKNYNYKFLIKYF
jgi:hypothetical protein